MHKLLKLTLSKNKGIALFVDVHGLSGELRFKFHKVTRKTVLVCKFELVLNFEYLVENHVLNGFSYKVNVCIRNVRNLCYGVPSVYKVYDSLE